MAVCCRGLSRRSTAWPRAPGSALPSPPEQSFGQPNPNNVQRLGRADFAADVELQPGLVMTFLDANKVEVPGVIVEFDDQAVTVDFNHPLAGRTILFEVQIVSVKPSAAS